MDTRLSDSLLAFIEAAYVFETSDQVWLQDLLDVGRAVMGPAALGHAAAYDGSRLAALRVGPDEGRDGAAALLPAGASLITPELVPGGAGVPAAATATPAARALVEAMRAHGLAHVVVLNGCDRAGSGVVLAFWTPEPVAQDDAERAAGRRLAHHLAAAHRWRRRLRAGRTGAASALALSPREQQVFGSLAAGQTSKETAYALGISDATVRVLLRRARAKLGVKTRRSLLMDSAAPARR